MRLIRINIADMNLLQRVPIPDAQPGSSLPRAATREWHVLMRRAALATAHDAHQHAMALYLRALEIAAAPLHAITPVDDDDIAAYAVTVLNLADTCQASGNVDTGLRHLQQAGQALQGLLQTPGTPVLRQLALSRHLLEINASLAAQTVSRPLPESPGSLPAPWFDGQLIPATWGSQPQ